MSYQDKYGYKKLEWDKEHQINVKDRAQSLQSKMQDRVILLVLTFLKDAISY